MYCWCYVATTMSFNLSFYFLFSNMIITLIKIQTFTRHFLFIFFQIYFFGFFVGFFVSFCWFLLGFFFASFWWFFGLFVSYQTFPPFPQVPEPVQDTFSLIYFFQFIYYFFVVLLILYIFSPQVPEPVQDGGRH